MIEKPIPKNTVSENSSLHEKRELKRNGFIHDLMVRNSLTANVIGDLADLTIKGLMLVTEMSIEINQIFELTIFSEGTVLEEEISFKAQCLRFLETVHEGIYTAGFKITEIDDENQKRLFKLIEQFGLDGSWK